jgi:hypothetical protein
VDERVEGPGSVAALPLALMLNVGATSDASCMDNWRAGASREFRRASALPTTWYAIFAIAMLVVIIAVCFLRQPNIAAVALTIAVLPGVALQVLITAFIPLREAAVRTVLPRIGIWCGRLVLSGLTFALGAFVATLMAFDLEDVDSGSTANRYFYQFLILVIACVGLVAAIGGLVASAWTFFSSDGATRSRAALHALTTSASRDKLPLRIRMWLDSREREPMPNLESRPRTDHLIRVISTESASIVLLAMTLLVVGMIFMLAPIMIDWIS